MWAAVAAAAVCYPRLTPFPGTRTAPTSNPILCANYSLHPPFRLLTCSPPGDFKAYGAKKSQLPEVFDSSSENESLVSEEQNDQELDLGWIPAFPHVLVASMANFLFGFHIGVMNGPIVSIAKELGFEGNSILEGLVVSIFIAGAFLGSSGAGFLVDRLGFRRTLQVNATPLILGAVLSAQAHSLDQLLWGRFFVGLGIGSNAVLVPIYISEVLKAVTGDTRGEILKSILEDNHLEDYLLDYCLAHAIILLKHDTGSCNLYFMVKVNVVALYTVRVTMFGYEVQVGLNC